MEYGSLIVLFALLAIGAYFIIKARKKKDYYKTGYDIDIVEPAVSRTGVNVMNYINDAAQLQETKNHITHLWSAFRGGRDNMVRDFLICKEMGIRVVLDVDTLLFQPRNGKPAVLFPDARERVREFFTYLKDNNCLDVIECITPTDEPNLPSNNAVKALPDAVKIIREVATEYSELDGLKMMIVYYYEAPFPNMELFDILGFNNYHSKSRIFEKGQQYEAFKAKLRPDQKTLLIPGPESGQIPEPFYNFAFTPENSEVWGVCNFLWSDHIDGSHLRGLRVRGGMDNDFLQERYVSQMMKAKALKD